jgi:SAM-dependent methyltransferase
MFNKRFNHFLYSKYFCPVCNSAQDNFLPLPHYYIEKCEKYGFVHFGKSEMSPLKTYLCPSCGASDRERLMAFWIIHNLGSKFFLDKRIIHFAPENALSTMLKKLKLLHYETADPLMPNVNFKVDITMLPFADASYGFFICSHVLEHVINDDKAIKELYRILKPGGSGIILSPISTVIESTIEDTAIVTEENRWKYFGQNDHVRLYSHNDFVMRIKQHGFILYELGIENFSKEVFFHLGLKETSILYVVEK